MDKRKVPNLRSVQLKDGFFKPITKLVNERMLPYQYRALCDLNEGAEKSGAIENFKRLASGETQGHYGYVFQDSDIYKWIEAVAYSLISKENPVLKKQCDDVIDLIGRVQMSDGYINTYYQLTDITKRWTNLKDNHELYCAGHMLEAAVAYADATGEEKFLDTARRFVDHIDSIFGREDGKLRGYPGHEEIELALMRLYAYTGDEKALKLAKFFIDERGKEPLYFVTEREKLGLKPMVEHNYHYAQYHAPVREQETMDGHSVRAMYLLAGMIDVARETADQGLMEACERLLANTIEKRMYVTGGIGSTHHGEAFSFDYDLPGDTVYAETCASIALMFACKRMLMCRTKGAYADAMERALYNTCLAGMALDGEHFFYVNPLEVVPEASAKDPGKFHVLSTRPKWYGCACCPPNLARLLLSLGEYQYTLDENAIYVNLYLSSSAALKLEDGEKAINMKTEYPLDGHVEMTLDTGNYDVYLHLPAWCQRYTLSKPCEEIDGYLCVHGPFAQGEVLTFDMEMKPQRNWADIRVRDAAGCVALSYGPVVYCLEEKDNAPALHNLILPRTSQLSSEIDEALLGSTRVISAQGIRISQSEGALYRQTYSQSEEAVELKFIPYYKWCNRGENEMKVYVRER